MAVIRAKYDADLRLLRQLAQAKWKAEPIFILEITDGDGHEEADVVRKDELLAFWDLLRNIRGDQMLSDSPRHGLYVTAAGEQRAAVFWEITDAAYPDFAARIEINEDNQFVVQLIDQNHPNPLYPGAGQDEDEDQVNNP